MILKIANENRSIIRKGTYLFSLVEYPTIQEWAPYSRALHRPTWSWTGLTDLLLKKKSTLESYSEVLYLLLPNLDLNQGPSD